MSWTVERVKELKKMWGKGLTTVEIGHLLGMSKNAIVGKAHRLGLESRPSPIKHEMIRKKKVIKEKTVPVNKKESDASDLAYKKAREKVLAEKTHKKGVNLVDLHADSCRWPEGDPKEPDFHFCGKKTVSGKIYCEEHCHVAFSGVFKPR